MLKLRFEIYLSMQNPFSYEELVRTFISKGEGNVPTVWEFGQQQGMLRVAMDRFKEMEPFDAYKKFMQEMNENHTKRAGGCGTCGGGKTL